MGIQTTNITLAGLTLFGGYDNNTKEYYIGVPATEEALDLRRNSLREIWASKSLKALLPKDSNLGKKKVGRVYMTFVPAKYFGVLLQHLSKTNDKASALLTACLLEAIERRIDTALEQQRPEQSYEEGTREFFRELGRKNYLPKLTANFEPMCDYGKEVNIAKAIWKLPRTNVEDYNLEQMQRWVSCIISYNTLRCTGKTHYEALRLVA